MLETKRWLVALSLLGLLGCAGGAGGGPPEIRTGMLRARWTDPAGVTQAVPASFQAESPERGVIFTTLGKGGEHFRGVYVRVERSTKGHLVTEVYDGFSAPEWEMWNHEPDGNWTATAVSYGDFAHFYTGRVLATLSGSEGHSMRCRFDLTVPQAGLSRGGTGECQISDGGTLALSF